MRSVIGLSVFIGSTLGGFVPDLWHAGMFSLSGVLFGALGGIAGLWLGVRVSNNF